MVLCVHYCFKTEKGVSGTPLGFYFGACVDRKEEVNRKARTKFCNQNKIKSILQTSSNWILIVSNNKIAELGSSLTSL